MIKVSRLWRALFAMGMLVFGAVKVLFISSTVEVNHFEAPSIYWFIGALIFFSLGVFPRAIKPNAQYVLDMPEPTAFYKCFRPRTWGTMVFMMALGISVRVFELASDEFIAGFYLGLGLSLLWSASYYIAPIRAFIKEGK